MAETNEKLDRLLRANTSPRDAKYETISIDFYRTQLADFVLHLLLATREYQDHAVSYRSFNVAAGVLALKPGPLNATIGRSFGVNVKVDESDTINIHAEDTAVGKAEDGGYRAVSVLAVVGPTQEDHASGLHTRTLHPCGRCRGRLSDKSIVRPDTLFVSANEDFTVIDFSNLEGIKRLHDHRDESGVTTFELHDSHDLFTPLVELEAKAPHVEEVDDSEWQEKIGQYLLRRYVKLVM